MAKDFLNMCFHLFRSDVIFINLSPPISLQIPFSHDWSIFSSSPGVSDAISPCILLVHLFDLGGSFTDQLEKVEPGINATCRTGETSKFGDWARGHDVPGD